MKVEFRILRKKIQKKYNLKKNLFHNEILLKLLALVFVKVKTNLVAKIDGLICSLGTRLVLRFCVSTMVNPGSLSAQ